MLEVQELVGCSVFNLRSRKECIEFLGNLRSNLLLEISNLNHVIEWMTLEDQECEKLELEAVENVR
jgi:hypothetical protein